jgi:hypothetical protein
MLMIRCADGQIIKTNNWKDLTKPIQIFDCRENDFSTRMIGFEKYLRLTESIQGVNVPVAGLSKIIVIGRIGDVCTKVILNLMGGVCTCQKDIPLDKVYSQPIADNLWKNGVEGGTPKVFVNGKEF